MRFKLADLTVSFSTIGRNDYLRSAMRSVLDTEPAGTRLQLVANEAPGTVEAVADLLEEWPGPVEVHEVASRLPITGAHQRALDICTTPLINFMGDDDLCLKPRFERSIAHFNDIPDTQVISAWARRTGGSPTDPRFAGFMDLGPASAAEWRGCHEQRRLVQFCFPASIYRVQGLHEIGGCEDRWGAAFDVGITSRIARLGPSFALTDHPFGFRIHANSISSSSFEGQHRRTQYAYVCLERFVVGEPEPTFEEFEAEHAHRPLFERITDRAAMESRRHFRLAGASYLEGRRGTALRHGALSFAWWPPAFVEKGNGQKRRSLA